MIRIFGLSFLVFAFAAVASSWETTALRTSKGGLIRVGMPSQEALKELGHSPHNTDGGVKKNKKNEVLTYRGADGLYTISLSGGRVVKIMVTPDRD